ncbi:hypothetical protein [Gordonia sp. (in: high G+C Gram-positive bacteria)]|uniref:hypothetical protein n=1 Tax=Gordonia sp. (in: high G+C Gram-positive bacteria) TaxID=84139 RepID=UPI00168DBED8|nr:hypothetical protein [Gordonia sp. (in: high G+C Gram-positive bacteria)]NLG47024.1 hypothetical protein [Gordonia sp. (in: high G+C Gram-positive bacteria)]
MTSIQVADEVFVAAAPSLAGAVVGDRGRWRQWWPDLRLTVVEDRGDQGMRWTVTGPLTGTMEIWCEQCMDGFILHYYLHAEPVDPLPTDPRECMDLLAEVNRVRRIAGKEMSFHVKWLLEGDREAGAPAIAAAAVEE